jgi:uncharacterized protein
MPILRRHFLPDVNVWIALSWELHAHHEVATGWFNNLPAEDRIYFCRISQMGMLRLLTNPAVLSKSAVSTAEAWEIFDEWVVRGGVEMLDEPANVERNFRRDSRLHSGKGSHWTDSYLLSIASQYDVRLVTLDAALAKRSGGLHLHERLRPRKPN